MSTPIEKIPCKDCGGSDPVQVFLNIDELLGLEYYSSFCFGICWAQKGDPYQGSGKAPITSVLTQEEKYQRVLDVKKCRTFLPTDNFRGIPGNSFKPWGVRMLLSEYDGLTPYALGFPLSRDGLLSGWKCRTLKGKNFFSIGKANDCDPFGFERAAQYMGDTLWVTEGEFDAIALVECMSKLVKTRKIPVVSLNHGGGSIVSNIGRIVDRIKFLGVKKLALVLDSDDVGRKAEEACEKAWDRKIIIINKPKGSKDANEALMKGHGEEMGRLALFE